MYKVINWLLKTVHLLHHLISNFIFSMKEHSVTFRCVYTLYTSPWIGKWYTKRQLRRAAQKTPNGHSIKKTFHYDGIAITAIPINEDNYSYMIVCEESGECVLVDVGDSKPILEEFRHHSYKPSAILSTHKHWDHCYGNKEMLDAFPDLQIYGSKLDRPHCANRFVKNGEQIEIGTLRFSAIHVPGHTAGHCVYRLHTPNGPDCLFTGDFLFIAGIGKMFEGSAKRMLQSLCLLEDLPRSALVFPGHEYSLENIEFALTLEPKNDTLIQVEHSIRDRRMERFPSVPSILGDEFEYNPFLRTDKPELWNALRDLGYTLPDTTQPTTESGEDVLNDIEINEEQCTEMNSAESNETVPNCDRTTSQNERASEELSSETNNEGHRRVSDTESVSEVVDEEKTRSESAEIEVHVEEIEMLSNIPSQAKTMEEGSKTGQGQEEMAEVTVHESNPKNARYRFKDRVAILRLLRVAKDAYAERKGKLATEGSKTDR